MLSALYMPGTHKISKARGLRVHAAALTCARLPARSRITYEGVLDLSPACLRRLRRPCRTLPSASKESSFVALPAASLT